MNQVQCVPHSAASARRPKAIEGALALFTLLASALLLPLAAREVSPAPSLVRLALDIAHVLLLVAFLLVRRRRWRFDSALELPREPLAREAWRQFQAGLAGLVVAWAALYTWLALCGAAALVDGLPGWLRGPRALAVADALNAACSVLFFYLFLVLDRPSVAAPDRPGRDEDFARSWTACLCLGFVVALFAVLGRLGHLDAVGLGELGPMAGSFLAAVAMMYFFGRFDYRFMRVGRWAVAPLYLYVALQVAWDRVAATGGREAEVVFGLALGLKLYFLACTVRWSRSRALQGYFDYAAR